MPLARRVYVPAGTLLIRYCPVAPLNVRAIVSPRAVITATLAPGMPLPLGSVTEPVM
jgi:hypothetical protein